MNEEQTIVLNELEDGLPGISPAWGSFLCEASSYGLTLKNHTSGVEMEVEGDFSHLFQVFWNNEITMQTQRTWNDEQELTEYAACGIAILLLVKLTEYTVIRRAVKGEGVDYWLGYKTDSLFVQDTARLEVSGILEGNKTKIESRLKQKKEQTYPTDGELPAYIVVVEFGKPISKMVRK